MRLLRSNFDSILTPVQKGAFEGIRKVCAGFLGNHRADNYKEIIRDMMTNFKDMGVNMSLKIHFLYDHMDYFPENCGAQSDEQGERFHKDIALIEERFKGKNTTHMLGEYCWSICRETDPELHKRKSQRHFFLTK